MERTGRHVLVSGRVQGVAFRWSTVLAARQHGVAGWVRNLADGRVEGWLEGEPAAVQRMLAWLERGPPAAQVEFVAVEEVPPEGLADFEVRASSRR